MVLPVRPRERYAREALLPGREFPRSRESSRSRDGQALGVPVEQIARRRHELGPCSLKDIARSRARGYGPSDLPASTEKRRMLQTRVLATLISFAAWPAASVATAEHAPTAHA